jgi:hypothetical protein
VYYIKWKYTDWRKERNRTSSERTYIVYIWQWSGAVGLCRPAKGSGRPVSKVTPLVDWVMYMCIIIILYVHIYRM